MNRQIANILENYLGRYPSLNEYHTLKSQYRNIQKVNIFNKDIFISLLRKNKKKFFSDLVCTQSDIKHSVLSYFSKQENTYSIGKLYTIIELQTILVTTYTDVLGVLTTKGPDIFSSTIYYNISSIKKLATDIVHAMMITTVSDKIMGRHNVSSLVGNVNTLMEEYLRRHNKNCICYGSYSLHLLNPDVRYGDIDILQTNSRTFLIDLAFLIKFITGYNVVLLKVPYLKNYMVLKDHNDNHIIDSFNIRQDTMETIPKILIDNIYIVDPVLQLMSMLKMFSQIDRLEDIVKNPDKVIIRLATLLEYVRINYGIILNGDHGNMPMLSTFNHDQRIITVQTNMYNFPFKKCFIYLDENTLSRDILHLNADDAVDFENVSNSAYLIHNDTMYTYFSNTILLRSENEIHEISTRAISAHILLYQILTKGDIIQPLSDIINSLISIEKCTIYKVIQRDKKTGKHGIIDIEKDIITH
ncbi:SPV030 poly(A) polymerase lage subunit PAPL [Swinepox virus]|uniref:Poly(A) polymerase catalytic subunit n=1 Tax=Swinepox virus (strain Swine/Nebraska/17077-99/1999) TaxID=300880 RepID=PAP1_SWPV1|nr:poly(A) polymerase large subunit [Swinepox virus]Q8V3R4.1 RecName: Full=Poly(A) polymerase catalytic subunit; AltName: Full=Poly(A) polymerase large subunit; Short=PAP-L [Swinepox virus (strain 17077-99)]AAL69769.1 SPV030 poly(A) polymerase lage subunit PAPL [Swinepox virus]UED36566.1 poly(A) polymerase large subunit [Swinepox virus]UED36715.1 poly(A) polymerase large subunit [Swinepox virus]UUA44220.1 SPV030 [Swinepox virus]